MSSNITFRQSNWSFHEASIQISQTSLSQNIMVRQRLPQVFKKQYWNEIVKSSPFQFSFEQSQCLQFLLNDEEKFKCSFKQFYNNHLRLYEWHVLATEKHQEIKHYLFSSLLKKTIPHYKQILKENMLKNVKNSFKKQTSTHLSNYCLRSVNDSPVKPLILNKASSLPNSIHQSAVFPNPIGQTQDYHELFIKTLDACDGSKYIHYDFCKHQKGYENRNMYNNYIRTKQSKASNQRPKTFYQAILGNNQRAQKQNLDKSSASTLSNFSIIKLRDQRINQHNCNYSKFQLTSFDEEKSLRNQFQENRRKLLRSKTSKNLVLKKMPHQFGKQKASTAFIVKVHKPRAAVNV